MSTNIKYTAPQWQVDIRQQLPDVIQNQLLGIERHSWSEHARYAGKAQFFINYHRDLLATAAYIEQALQSLLDSSLQAFSSMQLQSLLSATHYLIERTQNHHQIEDHAYFPQFRRIMPSLGTGIDLLDQDHKLLDAALHELDVMMQNLLKLALVSRQQLSVFFDKIRHLQKILQRHLYDEEEVIIPLFLLAS
ncbi:MAG: hemerythrin domain-containing protein [Pseudomonadales bacterium]|nr:hemerythrin domain-containing protein [Pseudomonadales bacterium]